MSLSLAGNGTLTGVDADASGLLAEAGGIGSNVVQTVKTNTFTTSSTSYADVTGLSVTITPTSATSKILVIAQYAMSGNNIRGTHSALTRGTTVIYQGDADGSKVRASYGFFFPNLTDITATVYPVSLSYLDSPSTTSATEYRVRVRAGDAGSVFIGRASIEPNDARSARMPASITAIEVAA